MDPKGLVTYL